MPIKKYKSVEQMPDATVLTPLDSNNLRIAFELSYLAFYLFPLSNKPGVVKFKTTEEASRHREKREKLAVRLKCDL